MSRQWAVVPWAAPVTVAYATTALMAMRSFQEFDAIRIVCENDDATYTVIVNVTTSDRAKSDEMQVLTIPPGEQRALVLTDSIGVKVQIDAHTDTPGTTATMCFQVTAFNRYA